MRARACVDGDVLGHAEGEPADDAGHVRAVAVAVVRVVVAVHRVARQRPAPCAKGSAVRVKLMRTQAKHTGVVTYMTLAVGMLHTGVDSMSG